MPTVLVVDDEKYSRNFLKLFIEHHYPTFTVLEAASGDDAWEQIHTHDVDLATIDIKMPFVNGYELIKKIKETPGFDKMAFVVISAHGGDDALVEKIRDLGVHDILSKIDVTSDASVANPLQPIIERVLKHPGSKPGGHHHTSGAGTV